LKSRRLPAAAATKAVKYSVLNGFAAVLGLL